MTPESRRVPFFDYPALFASHEDEYMGVIRDVLSRGAFIKQRDVTQLEEHLAAYIGVKHAIGVGNCTDGLHIALTAVGIGPGDEVIFPSHTFVASAAAIHWTGATPVPVECGRDHLIDPDAVEAAITPRTRAILPVQLNGRTADMDRISALAAANDLLVIEDAAQSLGSTWKGKRAGSFGLAAAFSFYPAKVLGAFGDAGLIVTDDDALARKMRMLADHGRLPDGSVESWGMNSRLDNLHAAVLDYQFSFYEETIARRRAIATMYQEGLGDLEQLLLPVAPDAEPEHRDVFQNYEIEADRRDELKAFLAERGVGTAIQWSGGPVHGWSGLGFTQSLPFTEQMFTRCLLLPMHPFLSDEDVATVVGHIRDFCEA